MRELTVGRPPGGPIRRAPKVSQTVESPKPKVIMRVGSATESMAYTPAITTADAPAKTNCAA